MKAMAILLVLAFGAMQAVSITDCPCGSLCETKNSCPSEKHHSPSSDDCCSRSGKPIDNCFHLEPQTDLAVSSVDDAPVEMAALPFVALSPVPAPAFAVVVERPGLPPPERGSPLFLLHSSLLI
jgi:hypothetical protein